MKLCLALATLLISLSSFAQVKAYFNQSPRSSYTDPYRKITRAGDNLELVIFNEILAAKKSVWVAVQEFRLPELAKALIAKKRLGLDVRVIIEHDYNFSVTAQRELGEGEYEASKLTELRAFVDVNRNGKIEKEELETRDAIYMLKAAGIPLIDDAADSTRSGLMHHKFVVIDGKVTISTTANFTMSCIHGDMLTAGSRGNANSMLVINSTQVAKLFAEEFSQMWGNGIRGNFGHNKTYRGPRTVNVQGAKVTVQFSPTSRRLNWDETVNGLIGLHLSQSTKSIKAALFVFSDQTLADIMEERSNAGSKIGVLIEPKFAYRDYSELLDMLGVQMLNSRCHYEEGNNPWARPITEAGMGNLPRGDVLHHKFAVVDGQKVIVGSQNWSDAANYSNDETLIVVENRSISDLYGQEYERIKRNSTLGLSPTLRNSIQRQEAACSRFLSQF